MVVRLHDVNLFAAAVALVAADSGGQLDLRALKFLQARLDTRPLGAAGGVRPDRLVHRSGDVGDGVHEPVSPAGLVGGRRPLEMAMPGPSGGRDRGLPPRRLGARRAPA
jgi:hypothetical protein